MSTIDYTPELGKRFVTLLEESVTPEQFEQIRTLNDARRPGTCASHDYIDANEVMSDAFTEVIGHPADPGSASDSRLWSLAWDWAIEHYLSHSPVAQQLESKGYPEKES